MRVPVSLPPDKGDSSCEEDDDDIHIGDVGFNFKLDNEALKTKKLDKMKLTSDSTMKANAANEMERKEKEKQLTAWNFWLRL